MMSQSTAMPIDKPRPAHAHPPSGEADRALLDRFLVDRDEAAFEVLVLRHGPRVLRICRRWLGDGQDAEDACQATFLVLVHRGGEIRHVGSLGGWLCGVARKVAARARMRSNRRRGRESAGVDVSRIADRREADGDARDLGPLLRGEIDRLPQKYRGPIELCYWEGLSNEQAAERLKCPPGTLKWRLARAKEMLRSRLGRLGFLLFAFFFRQSPTMKAAEFSRRKSRRWRGDGRPPAASAGGLPASFVRDTVALAGLVRDHPPSFLATPPGPKKGRRRAGLPNFVSFLVIVGAIIGFLLAIPAIAHPFSFGMCGPNASKTHRNCH